MFDKLKKFIRNEFKKSNFKAFFFFLILSVIIWLFVQFSKHYTEILKVPVTYVNYPNDKIIDKTSDKLDLRVKQSGFQIAWFKLFRPTINIDLSTLPVDSTYLKYDVRRYHKQLLKDLPGDLNNAEFLDANLQIPFASKSVKKVPVVSRLQVDFAPGFSTEKTVQLKPDSVKISGAKSLIDTINELKTKRLKKNNVKNDIEGKVGIENPAEKLTLYKNSVGYSLSVQKFTERELTVPITLINAPKNLNINLYPPAVDITFKVSLKRYKQIQSIDFQVVCDFENVTVDQNFLLPTIIRQPEVVHNVTMSPKKVQYIIKK